MKFSEEEFKRQQCFKNDQLDQRKQKEKNEKYSEGMYLDICRKHENFFNGYYKASLNPHSDDNAQIKTFCASVKNSGEATVLSNLTGHTFYTVKIIRDLEKYITELDFSVNFVKGSKNRIDSKESILKIKQMIDGFEELKKSIVDFEKEYVKKINNKKV